MEARVGAEFALQPFMETLGATLAEVSSGSAVVLMPCTPAITQHTGAVHAGALTAVLDSACAAAASSVTPEGFVTVSVEFKVNLLSPAIGDVIRVEARVLRAGRTLTVCSADAWAASAGGAPRHVAVMQATMMAVGGSAA